MMIFKILFFVICVVCFLFSGLVFIFIETKIKALRINFGFFAIVFFTLGAIIITPVLEEKYAKETVRTDAKKDWNNVPAEPEIPDHDHKGSAPLSLYVTDGADVSETYYVEATDHDTYKFCYFHDDGTYIVKKEVPLDKVKFEFSNDDLPHRVEVLLQDDKPVFYILYLPEDSNSVQYDTDNK